MAWLCNQQKITWNRIGCWQFGHNLVSRFKCTKWLHYLQHKKFHLHVTVGLLLLPTTKVAFLYDHPFLSCKICLKKTKRSSPKPGLLDNFRSYAANKTSPITMPWTVFEFQRMLVTTKKRLPILRWKYPGKNKIYRSWDKMVLRIHLKKWSLKILCFLVFLNGKFIWMRNNSNTFLN